MPTRVRPSSTAWPADALVDPLTGFPGRQQLGIDLAEALMPGSSPKVLAVFDLSGLAGYERELGKRATDALVARLANRFARVIEPAGACYRARADELWAIVHSLLSDTGRPVLEAASEALTQESEFARLSGAFGAALLPDEGSEPVDALRLADQRLAAAAGVRARRDRRL